MTVIKLDAPQPNPSLAHDLAIVIVQQMQAAQREPADRRRWLLVQQLATIALEDLEGDYNRRRSNCLGAIKV